MKTINELKQDYLEGRNITQIMREERNIDYNTQEIIETAYELQTGEYQKKWERKEFSELYEKFTKEIATTILNICNPKSILEAGVGEATTFTKVLQHLNIKDLKAFGFDISWSRTFFAKKIITEKEIENVNLCTGNLVDIPFLDNSIELVYTYHSIEPNGGKEENILKELYRVTKNYLVLFEPNYEGTNNENRKRMESLGYIKELENIINKLNYKIIYKDNFKNNLNDKNPTSIIVIEKNYSDINENNFFACPITKNKIVKDDIENVYFCPDSMVVYPIIKGIPCLRKENAILATKYES